LRVHASLLLVSLLFGANYVFTKLVLAAVPARSWVFCRIAAATAVFAVLALAARRGRRGPPLRLVPGLALAALLGIVLNQVLFTLGLARTTPAHSAVINACIPTWTLVLAALSGQERLSARKVLAVLIAFAGVAVLLRVDELLAGGAAWSHEQLVGDLLTWANGVSFALHLILLRRLGANLDPLLSTAAMFTMATLMVAAWSLPALTAGDLAAATTMPTLGYALYGVLFATVLTYFMNTWALRHAASSQVALWINAQPLVAVAIGPFFAQPTPDWRFFAALALVATGLVLQTRSDLEP
jgi:drug/metabolite transporter (DMT)-like permease